jgi:hypothetical protein
MNQKHSQEVKDRVEKIRTSIPRVYTPTLEVLYPELKGNTKLRSRIHNMVLGRSVDLVWLQRMEKVFLNERQR